MATKLEERIERIFKIHCSASLLELLLEARVAAFLRGVAKPVGFPPYLFEADRRPEAKSALYAPSLEREGRPSA